MIEFFKNWCEGIIVAVIISIIIEAILPEGNHKKYVKVVIGIYLVFTILNPFLGKLNQPMNWNQNFNLPTLETATVDTKNIQELYANGIKETLKNELEEQFACTVQQIEIVYDETYENIEQITLNLSENGISQVEKIEIGTTTETSQTSQNNFAPIKQYISENYEISQSKIIIY